MYKLLVAYALGKGFLQGLRPKPKWQIPDYEFVRGAARVLIAPVAWPSDIQDIIDSDNSPKKPWADLGTTVRSGHMIVPNEGNWDVEKIYRDLGYVKAEGQTLDRDEYHELYRAIEGMHS